MIFQIIILVVSFFLDGILTNFLPFMMNNLSLFTPFFTLIAIISLYPFFKKKDKKYYTICFCVGILYDLFYTNLLFTNGIIFCFIGFIIINIYKKVEINFFTNILMIIFIIIIYQSILSLLLFIFNVVPISFNSILYFISHSLIINIFYGEILYLICRNLPNERRLN